MSARHAGRVSNAVKVAAVVTGLLLAGGAYVGLTSVVDRGQPTSAPSPRSSASAAPTPAPVSPAPSPTAAGPSVAMRRCAHEVRAAEAARVSTQQGVRHWAEHVDAYWGVVRGSLSYNAAQADWDRTRLAGPADLQRFASARGPYDRSRGTCRRVQQQLTGNERARGTACLARADAEAAAVQAARGLLRQWARHQHDMELSRARRISQTESRDRFRILVHEAPAALTVAHRAATAQSSAPACPSRT